MPRREQQPEPQNTDGAPEWMVTFSDCMTLLLTFFVLLMTFTSFDEKVYSKLKIIYCKAFSTITPITRSNRDALLQEIQGKTVLDLEKGSEKATLDNGEQDALLNEIGTADMDSGRVILIPSKMVFWGKGTTISSSGRGFLSLLASFLASVPNRIVIIEYGPLPEGPSDEPPSEDYALPRAWAVVQHLITVHGLDAKLFSISAATTLPQDDVGSNEPNSLSTESNRTLEIVLLDRSIYN